MPKAGQFRLGSLSAASCLLLLCAAAAPPLHAQLNSSIARVALTARIPDSAHVAWSVQPAPQVAVADDQAASLLFLQSSWRMCMGSTLSTTAHMESTRPDLGMFALSTLPLEATPRKFSGDVLPAVALGFLPRALSTQIPLVTQINPRHGPRTDVHGLLVITDNSPGASPGMVYVTVTAL